jgi:hypothetical protein
MASAVPSQVPLAPSPTYSLVLSLLGL